MRVAWTRTSLPIIIFKPEEGSTLWIHADVGTRVALIIQIHLRQNRADLAAKEAQRARKWAQDSLLVNIAESWVGMREVCLFDTPVFPIIAC